MDDAGDIDERFARATQHIHSLSNLTQQQLLQIYGLYKQATVGPCNIPKPRFYELKSKEKYDAWSKLQDMPPTIAKQEYVRVVCSLDPEFNPNEEKNETWVTVSTPLNTDSIINETDKTIFDFCKENNLPQIRDRITKHPEILNEKDEHGLGLVHWAADRGNLDILKFLLENNVDVNMTDDEGQTALHYAASCDYFACVQCLINAGADCTICDSDGMKPVDLASDAEILKLLKGNM